MTTTRPRLPRPPRILIASDKNHDLWNLEGFLSRQGYAVLREFSSATVVVRARAERPDVILLDARLARPSSLDLSRTLRDDPLIGTSTPILLLMTDRPGRKDHLAALRSGIWEIVRQEPNPSDLVLALGQHVLAHVEAGRAPRETLVDGTTGLYTSRGLIHRARELIFQAGRHNTSLACVAFAPEVGVRPRAVGPGPAGTVELVPRAVAVLRASGRHSDAIGQVGLGEFAVIAPGANGVGAVNLAQRLRRASTELGFELRAGYETIANLRYTPVEPKGLLSRASRALQLAKAEGKWVRKSSRAQ